MTGETFKASVICDLPDGTGIVFDFGYWDNAGGSVHIDTGIAAGNFQTLVQAVMQAGLTTELQFRRYRFACVGGTHNGEIGYVEGDGETGGFLSPVNRMPNEVCVSLKRSTGYASRRDRGRIFFGPLASTLVDNTNVNFADVTSALLQDVRDLLKANLVTQTVTLKPVILSAAGTHTGHIVNKVSIAKVLVHHKSRRPRVGV